VDYELTILMPCLDEAETLAVCIGKAQAYLKRYNIDGEVLIADNGSTDGSQKIAEKEGARVVRVAQKGYGAALLGGIEAARGRFIIMGDADDSYDFSRLELYVNALRGGAQLVMGNRFLGGIAPGAMPALHKYLGNPVLSGIGCLFFRSPCRDFHCGLRGFDRASIRSLGLQTSGMEFASEMVVKATLNRLNIVEVPTTLSPDGRSRPPHLRSWRDGWRHLRFLLLYSPTWLFLYPGLFLAVGGLMLMLWVLPSTRIVGGIGFDTHTLVVASALTLLGLQLLQFGIFTQVYSVYMQLRPASTFTRIVEQHWSLERGLVLGGALFTAGAIGILAAVGHWGNLNFGPMAPDTLMRNLVPAMTALLGGAQIAFASFFLSVLRLRRIGDRTQSDELEI
jgi:glycosyltransferase involved in cell wall biosynthesis